MVLRRADLEALADLDRAVKSGVAREGRIALGIPLRAVARNCKVSSPSAVSAWETGRARPRGESALLYARFVQRLVPVVERLLAPRDEDAGVNPASSSVVPEAVTTNQENCGERTPA